MSSYNLSPSDDQRISFVPAGPLAESMSKYKGIEVELYQDADDEKEEILNLRRKSITSIERSLPVQNRKDISDSHSTDQDMSSDSSLLYQNGPGIFKNDTCKIGNLSKILTTKGKLKDTEGELSVYSPSANSKWKSPSKSKSKC